MRLKLKKLYTGTVRNERGASLVEVLAVLVLTVMITGLLTYVLSFANTSLQQVSAREAALQESRDIIQHITSSVRQSGFLPAGMEPGDTAPRTMPSTTRLYLVKGPNEETIDYTWNASAQSLTVERRVNGEPSLLHTFSDHVVQIAFQAEQQHLRGPVRYTVTLEIQLPNNQTRRTVTTILSSDRH